MTKFKKVKLFVGVLYIIFVLAFLYLIFSKFTLDEISSYDFIRDNRDYLFQLKQSNLLLISILFVLFTVIWVFAAGFVSPLAIFAGFIFGKWFGLFFLVLGMIPSLFSMISIGSGLEEIINQNLNAPSVIDLITSPSIYIPLIAFFGLLIITIFFRKVFYKN